VATFLVRLLFRMDEYNLAALNLQIPFFAQYIALFVLGLIAYRRNWLLGLPDRVGRLWLGIAAFLALLWLPLALAVGAATNADFRGGWHWQAFLYALWESFFCLSMCIGVIYLFRRYLDRRGRLSRFLVPNAYTAYIIHAPVITILAFAARDIALYPLLKWGLMALVSVSLCFALSSLIRKLPYADRVL
jgi:surface polysaccharide O-acyltransferase-like enzyme